MKVYFRIVCLLFILFLISACAPASTPTQAATIAPQPPSAQKYHTLDTRTGNAEIDAVIAAVETDDPQALSDLFNYSTVPCRTVNALGGPPPCLEGEAQETPVEVLPFLGPEGTFLRKEEVDSWPGLEAAGLYAVYQVSDSAYSHEHFPKGDYAAILAGKGFNADLILQIKDGGIVRIDFILDDSPGALAEVLERDAAEMILAPVE